MRKRKVLLIVVLVLLSGCKNVLKVDAEELFSFSNDLLSPIVEGEKKIIRGKITYNGNETLKDITVLSIATYKNGEYEFKHTYMVYPTHTLSKGSWMAFSYELPDASYYVDKEIDIELSVYDYQNNIKLDKRYLKVRGPLNLTVNVDDYRLSPLEINRFTTMAGNEVKESFLFDGIENKYIIQEYHRIDPSLFHFKYQCNYQVTIDKAELMFIDRDNLFPSINISRDGFKVLPLTFTQEGENIFLHFKRMYINPSTYEISTTPLTGYMNTKYLYLPRNKQSKFNNYVFYLNVNGIGLNKISFNHEFKIETLRPLIGSCDSATYCVVGGRSYE